MKPITLTPAQLDAALGLRRAGKTAARPPTVTLASTRPVPLQLAGLAEVARLKSAK